MKHLGDYDLSTILYGKFTTYQPSTGAPFTLGGGSGPGLAVYKDGSTVWPRTSPGGKPAVYATRNGGETWKRLDAGLPPGQAWWTVKRQAMTADAQDPVGLYFGTTSGELWASRD